MKRLNLIQSQPVLAEFGPSSLKILDDADGLELSLERADNSRLTALCIERLVQSLQVFFKNRAWAGRRTVHCAIGARGVSLRHLTLPRGNKMELDRLVLLQIEREFPLLPEELAWGFFVTGRPGAGTGVEVLVAAIKRDLLLQYEEVLTGAGLAPVFTVAATVRQFAVAHRPSVFSILEIGRAGSELVSFENGIPTTIRTIPFGGETVTEAVGRRLGLSRLEAERLKIELHDPSAPVADAALRQSAREALAEELAGLAGLLQKGGVTGKLYLTGGSARLEGLPEAISGAIGPGSPCERLATSPGDARSAAILGLQRHQTEHGGPPPLVLRMPAVAEAQPGPGAGNAWKWVALAAVLAVVCLALRHAEPMLYRTKTASRLAELRQRKAQMPQVERELGFLQHLRTNQPPYLNLIHTFANSAPSGTRLTSISLNRRGELALRATLGGSAQVSGFRSKLVESGLFASVVVDEQTPAPEGRGNGVTVRITGQRGEPVAVAAKPGSVAPTPDSPPTSPPTSPPASPPASKPLGNPSTDAAPSAVLADRAQDPGPGPGGRPPAPAGTNSAPTILNPQ